MQRRILGAVVALALLGGGTSLAQTGGKGGAKGAPPVTGATTGTAAAKGAPPATSAAPSATGTAAPATSGTAAPDPAASGAPTTTGAPATSASEESARAFQQGREAFKADQFDRALALFKQSYALEASPGTLLNIALTEEKLGRPATALRDFERVVELLKADDDRLPIAKEGLGRVKVRAPHLKVERAAGAPPTMAIKIDGEPLAANLVGAEQAIDPGKHVVTTSVFGFEDRSYEITLGEGDRRPLVVEPGKRTLVEAAPTATTVAPDAAPSAGRLASFAITGAGLAALGVGIVTGALAASKKGELGSICPDPETCNGKGQRAVGEAYVMADVSTATLIAGGVAAAAGVVMLFTVGNGRALFVGASGSPTTAFLSARGRF